VVVCEHTTGPKAGKYLEKLGSYSPKTKERVLDTDRINYWMSQGAKPSETMHNMLVTAGVLKKPKINVLPKRKVLDRIAAAQKEAADKASVKTAKNAPKEEAPATAVEVAPAEVAKAEETPAV